MVAHNERTGIEEADALVDGAAAVPQVYERMSWACRPSHIGSLLGGLRYLSSVCNESLLRMTRVACATLTITIIPSLLLPTHRSTALRHEASTHSDGRYSYSDGVHMRDRGAMFVWCAMWPYGAWCTGLSPG